VNDPPAPAPIERAGTKMLSAEKIKRDRAAYDLAQRILAARCNALCARCPLRSAFAVASPHVSFRCKRHSFERLRHSFDQRQTSHMRKRPKRRPENAFKAFPLSDTRKTQTRVSGPENGEKGMIGRVPPHPSRDRSPRARSAAARRPHICAFFGVLFSRFRFPFGGSKW